MKVGEMISGSVTNMSFLLRAGLLDLRQTVLCFKSLDSLDCCCVNKEWAGPGPAQYPLISPNTLKLNWPDNSRTICSAST